MTGRPFVRSVRLVVHLRGTTLSICRRSARTAAAAGILAALIAGSPAVRAQAPPAPSPTAATTVSELLVLARKATNLSGVDVVAKGPCIIPRPNGTPDARPRVIDSYPRLGQTVPPGAMILHVTYDQPMSRCAVVLLNGGGSVARLEQKLGWQTPDGRTLFFIVDVQPEEDYRLWLNAPWTYGLKRTGPIRTFLDRYGTPAIPHLMAFSTSSGPPTITAQDVLRADPGLDALLVPISTPA
ncbi:MAG TPA: hypothetical protein VH353_09710, partial [Caulobacteraceae bacterium]|nr:hypothetical protein [Caulobacteraceae bacterium]